jgi:hypothetical protein
VVECNPVVWVECQEWVGHHLAVDRYQVGHNNLWHKQVQLQLKVQHL